MHWDNSILRMVTSTCRLQEPGIKPLILQLVNDLRYLLINKVFSSEKDENTETHVSTTKGRKATNKLSCWHISSQQKSPESLLWAQARAGPWCVEFAFVYSRSSRFFLPWHDQFILLSLCHWTRQRPTAADGPRAPHRITEQVSLLCQQRLS